MIAVVPVRGGRLAFGADLAIRECAGRVLLVGERTDEAWASIGVGVTDARRWEVGAYAPARWATGLAALLADEPCVVLPGSADGRDLLGRLAHALGRPAMAWCTSLSATAAVTTRHDGATAVTTPVRGPLVATLVPSAVPAVADRVLAEPRAVLPEGAAPTEDAVRTGEDEADPREVDLADADRIAAGGLGLGDAAAFELLGDVAARLGASLGATRPVADRGTVPHERQIGTTGVTVAPSLYLAFGISGAVQHTAGLGSPRRVVSVNTDEACPMMAMADLAIVADAGATVAALARRLEEPAP